MVTPSIHLLNLGYNEMSKENLLKTAEGNLSVALVPDACVLQRVDCMMYTDTSDKWTLELSKAKLFFDHEWTPMDALTVPIRAAQSTIETKLMQEISDLEKFIKKRRRVLKETRRASMGLTPC